MNRIKDLWDLVAAAISDFYRREINAAECSESRPPIRYDGDPTEVYLA